MTVSEFLTQPPAGSSLALQALWHMAHNDWKAAHDLVDTAIDRDSKWVHAHLHRVEGDQWNAGYWYRQAGKPVSNEPLEMEREAILKSLLDAAS